MRKIGRRTENSKILKRNAVKKILFIPLFFFLSPALMAASFDCQKAASSVEKMICADKEVSGLDDALEVTYKKALSVSTDKTLLTNQQKTWLKERNRCTDLPCLRDSYTRRLSELGTAKAEAGKTWKGRFYLGGQDTPTSRRGDSMLVKMRAGEDDMSIDEEDILLKIKAYSPLEKKIEETCGEYNGCEIMGVSKGKQLESASQIRKIAERERR